jgi:hypothetical protein
MKITVTEAYQIRDGMTALYEVGLPAKLAIQVQKCLRVVLIELEAIDKVRIQILEKFKTGVDGKEGKYLLPAEDAPNYAEFRHEFDDVMGSLIDLNLSEPFDLSRLEKLDVVVKPAHVHMLNALNEKMEAKE